jgi:copper(I)-binding protein
MTNALLRACAVAATVALAPAVALAADAARGDLRIVKPYARATPPGATTAGAYLTIENRGARDRLVGASSPAATAVEIHTMQNDRGVMKMRPVWQLEVPSRGRVALVPGGVHLMIVDPKMPLREHERFPIRLKFERAGAVDVEFEVEPLK